MEAGVSPLKNRQPRSSRVARLARKQTCPIPCPLRLSPLRKDAFMALAGLMESGPANVASVKREIPGGERSGAGAGPRGGRAAPGTARSRLCARLCCSGAGA